MKFKIKTLVAFAGLLGLSSFSKHILAGNDAYEANCFVNGRTVTLDYDGEKFRESVIPLKDVLLSRCARLHPEDLNSLGNVTLVAKAENDQARASLTVGNFRSSAYFVSRDYRALQIQAPVGQRNYDAWRLNFYGEVKVNRIVLQLREFASRAPLPPVVRRPNPVIYRPGRVVHRPGAVIRRVRRAVRRVHRAVRRVHRSPRRVHHGRGHHRHNPRRPRGGRC